MNRLIVHTSVLILLFHSTIALASEEIQCPVTSTSVTAAVPEPFGTTLVSASLVKPEKPAMRWHLGSFVISYKDIRVEVPGKNLANITSPDLSSLQVWISGSMDGGGPILVARMRVRHPNFEDSDIQHPLFWGVMVRGEKIQCCFIEQRGEDGQLKFRRIPD
jgi:hypothetical protein